jgi:hypothetical protein
MKINEKLNIDLFTILYRDDVVFIDSMDIRRGLMIGNERKYSVYHPTISEKHIE